MSWLIGIFIALLIMTLLANEHANETSVDDFGAGILFWLLCLLCVLVGCVILYRTV